MFMVIPMVAMHLDLWKIILNGIELGEYVLEEVITNCNSMEHCIHSEATSLCTCLTEGKEPTAVGDKSFIL